MKHEPITVTTGAPIKGINLRSIFSTINSRELTENIILFFLSRVCFMDFLASPFGVSFFSVLFFRKKTSLVCALFRSGDTVFNKRNFRL